LRRNGLGISEMRGPRISSIPIIASLRSRVCQPDKSQHG
jgi:hypothetical protein